MNSLRIALPAANGRVSPVFDVAQRLVLVDVTDGRMMARTETEMGPHALPCRAERLRELGASVLVCGAISTPLATLVADSGVQIVAFIAGEVEDVLAAYLAGNLPAPEFMMPGCPCPTRGRRRRRGRQGGPGHGRARQL